MQKNSRLFFCISLITKYSLKLILLVIILAFNTTHALTSCFMDYIAELRVLIV